MHLLDHHLGLGTPSAHLGCCHLLLISLPDLSMEKLPPAPWGLSQHKLEHISLLPPMAPLALVKVKGLTVASKALWPLQSPLMSHSHSPTHCPSGLLCLRNFFWNIPLLDNLLVCPLTSFKTPLKCHLPREALFVHPAPAQPLPLYLTS